MRNPFQAMIESQVAGFQTQLVAAMEELALIEVEGSAGGGAVRVTMTGTGQLVKLAIDPGVWDEGDRELMEDLICAAMRDALEKASAVKREKIVSSTPLAGLGVELPDMF